MIRSSDDRHQRLEFLPSRQVPKARATAALAALLFYRVQKFASRPDRPQPGGPAGVHDAEAHHGFRRNRFSVAGSSVIWLTTASRYGQYRATPSGLDRHPDQMRAMASGLLAVGGGIGTTVSAGVLFIIAMINFVVLVGVYRLFQRVRRGGTYAEDELNVFLAQRGLFGRLFRRLFRLIGRSWHMYPLGFLFGLGFGTATEIALLGISASEAAKGISVWSILVFPALFTAGMLLVDTTDGVLMLGAYGWAFVNPIRKLYYNLTITGVSVVVALAIGSIETLGLVADELGLDGGIWNVVNAANDNFGALGYAIIGVFVASWLTSLVVYRVMGYDKLNALGPNERLPQPRPVAPAETAAAWPPGIV